MNPTDPYETGFPKKGTYEKIPYHDSVGDLGFRHLSLAPFKKGNTRKCMEILSVCLCVQYNLCLQNCKVVQSFC